MTEHWSQLSSEMATQHERLLALNSGASVYLVRGDTQQIHAGALPERENATLVE